MKAAIIDGDDLRELEEGFSAGAGKEERQKAEVVLRRLGYVKEVSLLPKRKRGPKPRKSTNPTLEELSLRVEYLRLMCGDVAREFSSIQVLSLIERLLRQYKTVCTEGVFFSERSISSLLIIASTPDSLGVQVSGFLRPDHLSPISTRYIPTAREFEDWVTKLAKSAKQGERIGWEEFVDDAMRLAPENESEPQIYSATQILLGLALEGPSASDIDLEIARLRGKRSRKPQAINDNKLKIRSLEVERWRHDLYPVASRNQILATAIARLYRIRATIETCRWTPVDLDIERLYEFVRRTSYGNDPRDLPHEIAKLDELFIDSLAGQESSPFPQLFCEEMDPDPADVPEDGQLMALPPAEKVSRVQMILQALVEASDQRISVVGMVKKLVENCRCSKSAAYRGIGQAVDKGKVVKSGKILSLAGSVNKKSGAPEGTPL